MMLLHNCTHGRRPAGRAAAGLAAAAVLLATWMAGPAHAHGGAADLDVEAHPTDDSVHLIVHAIWEDGDEIEDGTVTAVATSPGGQARQPENLAHTGGGVYEGSLEALEPGEWSVEVNLFHSDIADGGQATETETVTIAGAAPVTEPEPEPEPEPAPDPAETEAEAQAAVQVEEDEGSDDGTSLLLIVAALVVLGAVVAGVFWALAGRKEGDEDDESSDGDSQQPESAGAPGA